MLSAITLIQRKEPNSTFKVQLLNQQASLPAVLAAGEILARTHTWLKLPREARVLRAYRWGLRAAPSDEGGLCLRECGCAASGSVEEPSDPSLTP